MHPEFAPVAFISAFSLILPLPWHWRTGNVATLSIIAWLFITNMIYAIDASIWAGNVNIVARVWCDISTKLIIGANFALPAACLCICIHLEQVSSVRIARYNITDKRRRQYFEAFMCIGFPLIIMALHYIIQGHRFDIIEDYGCRPATYFSIPSIFIIWLPPVLFAIGSIVYAGLALRHFMVRRLTFAAHLHTSNSALTTSRYLRLMIMAMVEMFWVIGVTAYSFWFTVMAVPIRPWTTWSDVHSDFLRVDQFPSLGMPPIVARSFCVLWWLVPASTLLFVLFFSFGKDAMDEYTVCISWIKTHVLRKTPSFTSSKGSFSKFSFSKKERSLPISRPTLDESTKDGTSMFSLTPREPPSPSSIYKSNSIFNSECDTISDISHYPPADPSSYMGKAFGSVSEFTFPPTPSTAISSRYANPISVTPHIPVFPPSPVSSLTSQRTLDGTRTPTSQRPFTYPSNDASHQNIDAVIFPSRQP